MICVINIMVLQFSSKNRKLNRTLKFIIRIKCLSNLIQLEPWNVMLKVISDMIGHWYDTILILLISAM